MIGATWEGPVTGSISWDYDARFNVQTETVNCTTSTNLACEIAYFGYDPDGVLSIAGPLYLDYDPRTALLTDTQVGAVTDQWSYNDFGEPTAYTASVNGAPVFSEQFTRDALGRITVKNETAGGTTTHVRLWVRRLRAANRRHDQRHFDGSLHIRRGRQPPDAGDAWLVRSLRRLTPRTAC